MKLPRLRISVRTMMAAIAVVALAARYVYPVRVQRQAVAAISAVGGMVQYDYELKAIEDGYGQGYEADPNGRPAWPAWLVKLLGPDYFGTVKVVYPIARGTVAENDRLMEQVGRLGRVEFLYFNTNGEFSDAGLARLAELPGLRQIRLKADRKISGTFLANLAAAATRLQVLELSGIRFKDDELAPLKGFSDLRMLYLNDCDVTDDDLSSLEGLTNLSLLQLGKNPISDAGLIHLKGLVKLQGLGLEDSRVTGAGLVHLQGLTRLTSLKLDRTYVDDLEPLRALTKLRTLRLDACPIDDDDLASIDALTSLEQLSLSRTRITDAGLTSLKKSPALGFVELIGTRTTRSGIAKLRSGRKPVEVMF